MVNEAREALRAFVEGRDFNGDYYNTECDKDDYSLLRTKRGGLSDLIAFWGGDEFYIFIAEACQHKLQYAAIVTELQTILGPLADPTDSKILVGGPLTWLALKAALTTGGGNDA